MITQSDGFDDVHLRGFRRFVAGVDRLASHMADSEGKDSLCRHEAVGFRARSAAQNLAMRIERESGRHLQRRPKLVGLARNLGVRRANDDMARVGVLPKHKIKGCIKLFRRNLPSDERARGKVRGKQGLAHAADRPRFEHVADAFQHGRKWQFGLAGNFSKGIPYKAGNLVLRNRKNTGIYRISVFNRNHKDI